MKWILPNVIVPAFSTPYVGGIFVWPFLLVAFAGEVLVCWWLNRNVRVGILIGFLLLANAVSTLLGFALVQWLPTGYDPTWQPTAAYGLYAKWSWGGAYGLSVLVEGLILRVTQRRSGLTRIISATILGNAVSYAVCAGAFYRLYVAQ